MDERGLLAEHRDLGNRNLYQQLQVKAPPYQTQHQAVKEALWAIEQVLNLPSLPTQCYSKIGFSFKRQDAFGKLDAQSERATGSILLTFRRSLPPEDLGLTVLHELGHLLDLLFFEPVAVLVQAGITKPELEPVLNAARTTRAWQQYRGRLQLAPADDDAGYLNQPEELCARAFAQYIAVKSGNENLLAAVKERAASVPGQLPEHWSPEDFAVIQQAIDNLFQAKGWLR